MLAALPDNDPIAMPAALLSAAGVAAAMAIRAERHAAPLPPDTNASHAADLLRMIRGTSGDATEVKGLRPIWSP